MPELADSLERILESNGLTDAAASVRSLVIGQCVTSASKAELGFGPRLSSPSDLRRVSGRHGRTNVHAYIDDRGRMAQLTLAPLGMLRPALRRLCERHQDFDWDAYYGR
jgi:hypothetical protein